MLALSIDTCSRLLFEVTLTEMSYSSKRKKLLHSFQKKHLAECCHLHQYLKPSYSNMHNSLNLMKIFENQAFHYVFQRSSTLHTEYYIHLENWHLQQPCLFKPATPCYIGLFIHTKHLTSGSCSSGNKDKGRQKLLKG